MGEPVVWVSTSHDISGSDCQSRTCEVAALMILLLLCSSKILLAQLIHFSVLLSNPSHSNLGIFSL